MRHFFQIAAVALLLAGCTTATPPKGPSPEEVTEMAARDAIAGNLASIADANRPAEDVARDVARNPAAMLAFAGVKPGDKVVDFIPGAGYFTRLFAKAVGANGHVYGVAPPPRKPDEPAPLSKIVGDPAYPNVSVVPLTGMLAVPEPVDLVWTAQNYHDLHLAQFKLDVVAMNKAVFDALKPGGVYVIVDHAALPGSGLEVPDKLHRIDPAIVKQEVIAAGFEYEDESTVLRNDTDDHTLIVFDPKVRGKTDQFAFRFRKPQ